MKKIFLALLFVVLFSRIANAAPFKKEVCNLGWEHVHHDHSEEAYQYAWCSAHNGIMEHQNKDFTRVDCLTDTHAVEFDFANKWAESIGQAVHYGIMTGKKPKVVLILDSPKTQMVYYKRIKAIGKKYQIDTEYVTDEILSINSDGKCNFPECKCHKTKGMHQNQIQQELRRRRLYMD